MFLQALWLADATATQYAVTECVETRTWEDIAKEKLKDPQFTTGGLGAEHWPNYRAWACWQHHSCLTPEHRESGDAMCYVYDERGRRWLAWGPQSQVMQCAAAV